MRVKYAHEMQSGDEYESLEFDVTPDLNQQFLYAVGDFNPIFVEESQNPRVGRSQMSTSIFDPKVGEFHSGKARKLRWARALALSGGPWKIPGWPEKNSHTDLKAANDAGLSAVVVSGTQWKGYLVGLREEILGPRWFRGAQLDIKIPHSVKIDETLQPKARVEARDPHGKGERVALSVWCENQDGQQVLVGSAWCVIAARAPG